MNQKSRAVDKVLRDADGQTTKDKNMRIRNKHGREQHEKDSVGFDGDSNLGLGMPG
jgi:hypothetical protein